MSKLPKMPPATPAVVKPKKPSPFLAHLNLYLLCTLIVVMIFDALIANSQATNGRHMASLELQQQQLQDQIESLQQQVTQVSSLGYIRQYATDKLGMQPVTNNILYMPQPSPAEH